MARGFSGVREASAELKAKRQSGAPSGAGVLWFRIKSGQEAKVRFLEQDEDIFWAMVHEIPVEGRSFGFTVPCLDQDRTGEPCPGCERELKRKFLGYINMIWFDAPVYQRDENNRIVKNGRDPVVTGTKDQPAVWSSGINVFDELDEINGNYRGLTSRHFKIKRRGEGLDTKYSITPADVDSGPQEITPEEEAIAQNKYDLTEFVKPPSYDEFMAKLGQGGGGGNGGGFTPQNENPFMRR